MNRAILSVAGLLLMLPVAGPAADGARLATSTRYDEEYPVVGYSGPAVQNRVWDLQQRLAGGQTSLAWEPGFGYLRSLLRELEIDRDTQVLVFSRTSLQIEHISALAPRAVYFNDDTYVGYVQGTGLIEITSVDAQKGPVFYAFDNRRDAPVFQREGGRCLTCHDTYSMTGGGVPRVMVMSAPVEDPSDTRTATSAEEVDDRTPIARRWGGWYVTGRTGGQTHFGNLPLREEREVARLRELADSRLDRQTLQGYFDTSGYLTDRSDVVALLVLEHQTFLQNLITRVDYKVRTVLSREDGPANAAPRSWAEVGPRDQQRLRQMIEPLVRALFFHEAAPFEDPIWDSSGFAARFSGLGPRDSRGRSLRELELHRRLFRLPLSYMIYSKHFDRLPPFALDYLRTRIAEVLSGRDTTGIAAKISPADRAAISQILAETKPSLAP